jgi:aminomethyltransferase
MDDLGQEAGFVGKEALRRIKAEGPRRKLVGIEIGGPPVGTYIDCEMIDMYPVFLGGEQVGKVTSACYSPRLEKTSATRCCRPRSPSRSARSSTSRPPPGATAA